MLNALRELHGTSAIKTTSLLAEIMILLTRVSGTGPYEEIVKHESIGSRGWNRPCSTWQNGGGVYRVDPVENTLYRMKLNYIGKKEEDPNPIYIPVGIKHYHK